MGSKTKVPAGTWYPKPLFLFSREGGTTPFLENALCNIISLRSKGLRLVRCVLRGNACLVSMDDPINVCLGYIEHICDSLERMTTLPDSPDQALPLDVRSRDDHRAGESHLRLHISKYSVVQSEV